MPKFTDKVLRAFAVEPGKKDRLAFDTECPGLGVRATARGTRTFIAQWTDPATKRKVREPLGVWGAITIDQARAAARARLGDVARGIDPSAERRRQKAAAAAEKAESELTLDRLIAQWGELHLAARRPRYAAEAQRALRFAFAEHLSRPAVRLTRAAVVSVLDKLTIDGKIVMAGQTMAYGRACYAWAEKRERVTVNPFHRLPIAAVTSERDRVLSAVEVHEVWKAAGTLGYPFGPFHRLALLTLQRREEVAGMRWSEISADGATWTIPAGRMKNNRPHDVHLAEEARAVLTDIPRQVDSRGKPVDLVFTTTGKSPISGFSRAKAALDALIVAERAERARIEKGGPKPLTAWRSHDYRRTGVSRLAAMGFDSIVADKLLAHKPAKLRGVASVYQRHDFAAERRKALEAWAAEVVWGEAGGANVVPLRA